MEQAAHADASMDAIARRVAALAPGEKERLRRQARRYDALSNSYWMVFRAAVPNRECKVEMPKALEELREEARGRFDRYREELRSPVRPFNVPNKTRWRVGQRRG